MLMPIHQENEKRTDKGKDKEPYFDYVLKKPEECPNAG